MPQDYVYDIDEVARPASQDDLVRDRNGFTNPNLHRRVHPVNGLPLEYITAIGLTWAGANELGLTWENSAGEYSDFYNSDYILTLVKPSDWDKRYYTYYTRTGSGTDEDPYVYTLVQRITASWQGLSTQTWDSLLNRTWDNLADRPQWVAGTYYRCEFPVITESDGVAVRTDAPIVVDTLPDNPTSGAIYFYNNTYYVYKEDEFGAYGWVEFIPTGEDDNDGDNLVISAGRRISKTNQRKNKKTKPSDYYLHIQNRDSFRGKTDTFISINENADNSHMEIP